MARVPKRFLDETLWPEFCELNKTLAAYLGEMTDRIIAQGIESDSSEVEVVSRQGELGVGATLGDGPERDLEGA